MAALHDNPPRVCHLETAGTLCRWQEPSADGRDPLQMAETLCRWQRPSADGSNPLQMAVTLCRRQRISGDGKDKGNEDIRMMDLLDTLIVVNSHESSLTQIVLSYSIHHRIGLS